MFKVKTSRIRRMVRNIGATPDWDLAAKPIEQHDLFTSLRGHLRFGLPLTYTGYNRRLRRRARHLPAHQREKFIKSGGLRLLHTLLRSLQEKGYQPQEEDNIQVSVGRSGELIQTGGGTHRIMLAHLLGIEEVWVEVHHRHPEWETFRDELTGRALRSKRGGLYQQAPHPDLQHIPFRYGGERAGQILSRVPQGEGRTMLDFGANMGLMCHLFEDLGYECLAVEHNPELLLKLREAEGKQFLVWTRSILELEALRADVLVALNIFRHLMLTEESFHQTERLLRQSQVGEIFFSTHDWPEEPYPENAFKKMPHDKMAAWLADLMGKEHIEVLGRDHRVPARSYAPEGRTLYHIR